VVLMVGRTWIELDQIAVHRACRRQGVARTLVAQRWRLPTLLAYETWN